MTAAPASDAEALSCATAARYAGRWALGVTRPLDTDDRAEPPAPWFIDGFAGADLQRAALRGATVQPAALLAVQALDEAGARARIVLIEEDPGLLARLGEMLEGIGAGERVRISSDPATAEPGEILLVESTFAAHAHRLAQRMGDEPALLRLAPLAARTLPWSAVEPLMDLAAADVLLRFPREDFEKQARFTGPLADLPPHLRRVVEGCSGFLGDARHAWVFAWRQAQRAAGPDAALATAIERMQALLAPVGGERVAPALHVAGKTESVHLLLSTPNPEHPLELDAALAEGAARPKPASKRKAASAKSAPPAPAAAPVEPAPVDAADEPAQGSASAPPPESAEPLAEPAAPLAEAAEPADDVEPDVEPVTPLAEAAEPADNLAEPAEEPLVEPFGIRTDAESPEPAAAAEPAELPAIDASPVAAPGDEPAAPTSKPATRPSKRAAKLKAPDAPPADAPPLAVDASADALDLFALASEPEPEPRGPDLAAFGEYLHARHIGTQVAAGDLLESAAGSGLTPEHVRAALAGLKRAGRVSYKSLDAEGAEVEFLAEPRTSAPRPRKPRAPAPDLLGLFDEPEE